MRSDERSCNPGVGRGSTFSPSEKRLGACPWWSPCGGLVVFERMLDDHCQGVNCDLGQWREQRIAPMQPLEEALGADGTRTPSRSRDAAVTRRA